MSGGLIKIIQHLSASHWARGTELIIPALKLEPLLNEELNIVFVDAVLVVAKGTLKFNFLATFDANRSSRELRKQHDQHRHGYSSGQ